MTNFIPVFPLELVVYPGETVNLHIFEPRYKQLIQEYSANGKPFGIPVIIDQQPKEFGASVVVSEVVERYEDGTMDIRVTGQKVFRILELIKQIPDKLYSGAIVSYLSYDPVHYPDHMKDLFIKIQELYKLLQVQKKFSKPVEEMVSFDIAHHIGLQLNQEYELLELNKELERLEYIRRHITQMIQVLQQGESLKEKIQLNGHFRELKGFNFDF
jgi:Lon protease-like protein